jgi:hypothetical protein
MKLINSQYIPQKHKLNSYYQLVNFKQTVQPIFKLYFVNYDFNKRLLAL